MAGHAVLPVAPFAVVLLGLGALGCGPDGSSCETESDCSGGICERGMCTTECACDGDPCGASGEAGESEDCEEGWLCVDTSGVFQPIYRCEPTCTTDADCPEARPTCNVDTCR